MKKYYAKEISNDNYFDYENYFTEDDARNLTMWIGGNKELISFNDELIEGLMSQLEDYDNECEAAEEQRELLPEEYLEIASGYFRKVNGNKLTIEDLKILIDCREAFAGDSSEVALQATLLEIIYDEPFTTGIMRGSCQRDWIEYICPDRISDEEIDYIEAVIFGTGTEYEITTEPIESEEDFDTVDTIVDYTSKYRAEDVKKWVAQNLYDCTADDVVILTITGSHTTTTYDYTAV